jgi:hypothetical protein
MQGMNGTTSPAFLAWQLLLLLLLLLPAQLTQPLQPLLLLLPVPATRAALPLERQQQPNDRTSTKT